MEGIGWLIGCIGSLCKGKEGFDVLMMEIGRMVVEVIMYIDREQIAGPDYAPFSPEIRKWASGRVREGLYILEIKRYR